MNEMVKGWLKELYEGAIAETKATIANERIWAKGAPNDETIAMHDENARLQEEYLAVLQVMLDDLDDRKVCEDCGKKIEAGAECYTDDGLTLCCECDQKRANGTED